MVSVVGLGDGGPRGEAWRRLMEGRGRDVCVRSGEGKERERGERVIRVRVRTIADLR